MLNTAALAFAVRGTVKRRAGVRASISRAAHDLASSAVIIAASDWSTDDSDAAEGADVIKCGARPEMPDDVAQVPMMLAHEGFRRRELAEHHS